MTDPDQTTQSYDLTVMTAIRAGFWRLRAEKEILLLLAGLMTIITLLYYALAMGNTMAALSAISSDEEFDPATFQTGLGAGYWLATFLFMYLNLGPTMVWARVSMLGRDAALEDGLGALARQTLWGLWRYICLMGWMVLVMFALIIVGFLIALIFGVASGFESLANGGADPAAGLTTGATILVVLFYLAMIVPMLVLTGAWMVTLNAEARDVHLSINKALNVLGGKAWALTGAIFLIWIGIAIILVLLMFLLGPVIVGDGLSIAAIFVIFALFTFAGAIVNFALLSIAGFYAAHLVPELIE